MLKFKLSQNLIGLKHVHIYCCWKDLKDSFKDYDLSAMGSNLIQKPGKKLLKNQQTKQEKKKKQAQQTPSQVKNQNKELK